jgi:hypothetical protein
MLDYRLYMRTDPSGGFQQPLAGRCQERLDIRRIVLAAYQAKYETEWLKKKYKQLYGKDYE